MCLTGGDDWGHVAGSWPRWVGSVGGCLAWCWRAQGDDFCRPLVKPWVTSLGGLSRPGASAWPGGRGAAGPLLGSRRAPSRCAPAPVPELSVPCCVACGALSFGAALCESLCRKSPWAGRAWPARGACPAAAAPGTECRRQGQSGQFDQATLGTLASQIDLYNLPLNQLI